jgi:excisionase family DNA binding protein
MAATYTVKQVAQILGYSTNSIYSFLKEKRLKGVRVGTGRFRIPQSELDRLLMTTKKQPAIGTPAPPEATPALQPMGVADISGSPIIERTKLFGFAHLGTLNIFDWFIGTVAVVTGFTLFLFTTFVDRFGSAGSITILPVLRIILIGGGAGILITNLIGQTHQAWHKIFHILIALMLFVIAYGFAGIGEIDGALSFGFLGILVLAATVIHIGGAAWVSLYISALTVTAVLSLVFTAQNSRVTGLLSQIPISHLNVVTMVTGISLLLLIALWYGYKKSTQIFMIATWVAAFWYFVIAFWYATDSFWTRSFFFVVVGMTSLFLSPWESLASLKSRKADLFTLGVFGAVFLIIIIGVTGVYLLQSNIISTVDRENTNKLNYAEQSLEATIESVKLTIVGTGSSSEFIDAVAKNDPETINVMERVMYDSNNAIRRLMVLDRDGQGVSLYPFETFDQPDLSGRDYFIQARDTGVPYVTDLFEAATDRSRRLVVLIATPLYLPHHEFAGVLVAYLNLDAIGARLQKIAVPDRREYIEGIDSQGKYIIHPDSTRIGIAMDKDDPVFQGVRGDRGTVVGTTYTGERAMVTYIPVDGNGFRWVVAIISPTATLYSLTNVSNISIFSVVIASVIIAGSILAGGFFYRIRRATNGGSP